MQLITEITKQLAELPRVDIATQALKHSSAILLKTIDECIQLSNEYAPEHLILASEKADNWIRYYYERWFCFYW